LDEGLENQAQPVQEADFGTENKMQSKAWAVYFIIAAILGCAAAQGEQPNGMSVSLNVAIKTSWINVRFSFLNQNFH
jgi:hypothetical protein